MTDGISARDLSHHVFNLPVHKEPWRLIGFINMMCSFVLYNITHCGVDMQFSVVIQPSKSWNNVSSEKNLQKCGYSLTHTLKSDLLVMVLTWIFLHGKKGHRLHTQLPSLPFPYLTKQHWKNDVEGVSSHSTSFWGQIRLWSEFS